MSAKRSLAERRRLRRRNLLIASGIALVFFLGALLYASWQPSVRIVHIEVYGFNDSLARIAEAELAGSYLSLVPRNSIFFYPERAIRKAIYTQYGEVAAVSLFRNGLTGLTIRVTTRVPIARWCPEEVSEIMGTSTPEAAPRADCYFFDDQGLLYATTTDAVPVNSFSVHAPLPTGETTPRGQTLPQAEQLPSVFNFAREIAQFGSLVQTVSIEEQEVALKLESGTRVRYVLGQEEQAFSALVSAKQNLNLRDGSLEYIDLRFEGKVYLKRRDASLAE